MKVHVRPCLEDLSYVIIDAKRRRIEGDAEKRGKRAIASSSSSPGNDARHKKTKEHGNYDAYYGYRLRGQEDPRLAIIKPEWCGKE